MFYLILSYLNLILLNKPGFELGYLKSIQVILWDLGEHHRRLDTSDFTKSNVEDELNVPCIRYVAVSSIEASHRTCVTDLLWLPSFMEVCITSYPYPSPPQELFYD